MTLWRKSERNMPTDPDEAAAWWLAQLSSDVSVHKIEQFESWYTASPENMAAYIRMQKTWQLAGEAKDLPAAKAARTRALGYIKPKAPTWQWAIAASLVLTVVAGGTYEIWGPANFNQPAAVAGRTAQPVIVYSTGVGEVKTLTLQDGSRVALDTNSAVRVTFSPSERGIQLLRGQANFMVAKHQRIPFVVQASGSRVTATGTAFDVRIKPTATDVTLIEGRVLVENTKPPAHKVTDLLPGQCLTANPDGTNTVTPVDLEQATAWKDGRLIFVSETLVTVANELNRYSVQHIRVNGTELQGLRLSGVFRTGHPWELLAALQQIHPVMIETDRNGDLVVTATKRGTAFRTK